MTPDKLLFAETHEWVQVDQDAQAQKTATVGISAFAVESLTDLVYIELPKVGQQVSAGKPFGQVESVKAVSDLYSPVDGEVVAVNDALANQLDLLHDQPYDAGWMIKIKISNEQGLGQLLDYKAYQKLCADAEH